MKRFLGWWLVVPLLLGGIAASMVVTPVVGIVTSPPVKTSTRPAGIIGYYKLDDPSAYGVKAMSDLPVGQIRYLGIEKDRWMIRDFMVAFGGSWKETDKGAELVVTEGPSGPNKSRDKLSLVRTETGVEINDEKQKTKLRFTYLAESAPAGFGYDEVLGKAKP